MVTVLVLCRYFKRKESETVELAHAKYMECVPLSDAVDGAMTCVCLP